MPVKVVEVEGKKYAELGSNGQPIYTVDGKEIEYDGEELAGKVTKLNGEAMGHRKAKETAEEALKVFTDAGITDAKKAKDAMDKVAALGDGDLQDAAKVQEKVDAAVAAVEDKYKPIVEERDTLKNSLVEERGNGQFARSTFIEEKMARHPTEVEALFSKNFSLDENGKMQAKDANGNPIYSKEKPGELAGFDEALSIIVDASPLRENLLKGANQNGTGANGAGNGSGANGAKTITRAEFEKLDPVTASKQMEEGFTVVD